MHLLAWTAAYAVYICFALILLLLVGCAASLVATGRTRLVIQFLLALLGLAIAMLMSY